MTNKERIKILEMVAAGKLSVEQASELMDILGAKSATDAEKQSDQELRATEYNQEAMGRIRGYRRDGDRGLRAVGLPNLTAEEIGALKMYGVGTNYVKAMLETGLSDLTVKQIISLKNYGINANYVRSLLETGLGDLSPDQIISLKNYGVSAEYIRSLLETGLSDLTVKQIIRLKNHGVDPLFASSYLNEKDEK